MTRPRPKQSAKILIKISEGVFKQIRAYSSGPQSYGGSLEDWDLKIKIFLGRRDFPSLPEGISFPQEKFYQSLCEGTFLRERIPLIHVYENLMDLNTIWSHKSPGWEIYISWTLKALSRNGELFKRVDRYCSPYYAIFFRSFRIGNLVLALEALEETPAEILEEDPEGLIKEILREILTYRHYRTWTKNPQKQAKILENQLEILENYLERGFGKKYLSEPLSGLGSFVSKFQKVLNRSGFPSTSLTIRDYIEKVSIVQPY